MNRAAELDALIDELTVDASTMRSELGGFLVGADAAIRRRGRATLAGVKVEVPAVDCSPDARAGLLARVRHGEAAHEVSLADLRFAAGSEFGVVVVAAYRRWQAR